MGCPVAILAFLRSLPSAIIEKLIKFWGKGSHEDTLRLLGLVQVIHKLSERLCAFQMDPKIELWDLPHNRLGKEGKASTTCNQNGIRTAFPDLPYHLDEGWLTRINGVGSQCIYVTQRQTNHIWVQLHCLLAQRMEMDPPA